MQLQSLIQCSNCQYILLLLTHITIILIIVFNAANIITDSAIAFVTSVLTFTAIFISIALGGGSKFEERCRYWPACKAGDSCQYHHPTLPCM